MNRRNVLMRNGQANADSSGWTSLKKHDEQFTSSTHLRSCVRHDGDHDPDDSASGFCQQEAAQCDALSGSGGHENITFRMASQDSSIRNRISEDVARSELEAMERDARHALFRHDQ